MGVDWGRAIQVGGAGFSNVFLVSIFLAGVILLTGVVVRRTSHGEDKDSAQKGVRNCHKRLSKSR